MMLAEMIIELGNTNMGFSDFEKARNELAMGSHSISLVRVLKLRLREKGIDL